jgi:dTDP-4-amino-4,6-dideoxygalactose transaminase
MDRILQNAQRYRLPVVEDACQAIGATYRGRCAGTMGDFGCFSFFPSKNLGGAGDGGMVVTSSAELAAHVRLLRGHGARPKYHHAVVGFNSRLDEIQAAILRVKLGYLTEWSRARGHNAESYEEELRAAGLLNRVRTPVTVAECTHIFHQYVLRCRERDELHAFLKSKGIGTEIYYPLCLHEQECFRYLGYSPGDMPRSRAAAQEVLALPIYPELTRDQISCVVGAIAEFFGKTP